MWQPIEYSLSTKGVQVTGGTNNRDELAAFIEALQRLLPLLPAPPTA